MPIADTYTMLPYHRQGEIDYDSLEFDADKTVEKPEAMEQHLPQDEIVAVLHAFFTEFSRRPDVFLDRDSNICYDRSNLNVRVSPDAYLAFGVDARAIRPRKLYLPWEAGKPPDWVLEVASSSTGREDVRNKPGIYARIGVPEYWLFDPTGGDYHREPMAGLLLSGGVYRPVELTTEPDGILKGYSPVLQLSLSWDAGWPRFYNPADGTYLPTWQQTQDALHQTQDALREEQAARERAEAERDTERTLRLSEQLAREEAESELQRLREQIRRQQPPANP